MRNTLILIGQIKTNKKEGLDDFHAVLQADSIVREDLGKGVIGRTENLGLPARPQLHGTELDALATPKSRSAARRCRG